MYSVLNLKKKLKSHCIETIFISIDNAKDVKNITIYDKLLLIIKTELRKQGT